MTFETKDVMQPELHGQDGIVGNAYERRICSATRASMFGHRHWENLEALESCCTQFA